MMRLAITHPTSAKGRTRAAAGPRAAKNARLFISDHLHELFQLMTMPDVNSPTKQAPPPTIATMNVAMETTPQMAPVPTYHAKAATHACQHFGI